MHPFDMWLRMTRHGVAAGLELHKTCGFALLLSCLSLLLLGACGSDQSAAEIESCSGGDVVPDPASRPGLVSDCETLLSVRDKLAGDIVLDWGPDRPIAEWGGIEVEGSPPRVTTVEYIGIVVGSLTGTISPELGNLSELRHLRLMGNGLLRGGIPPELGRLRKLETLLLNNNSLSGQIPPELGNLAALRELDLNGNDFQGIVPPELGRLSSLERLRLSRNSLEGNIPPELGDLGNLVSLALNSNELTGTIPAELANLSKLVYLIVDRNRLSGCIPSELHNMSMRRLSISADELEPC